MAPLRFAAAAVTASVALAAQSPTLFSKCRTQCMEELYSGDYGDLVALLDANTNKARIVCDDKNCGTGSFCDYSGLGDNCRLCFQDPNVACTATGSCFGAKGVSTTTMTDAQRQLVPNCGGLSDAIFAYQYQDYDMDGLSDAEEQTLTTSPTHADSDGDKLSDGDEVNINWAAEGEDPRYTDPKNGDTDGDGIPDGEEVIGRYIISSMDICGQVQSAHHDLLDGVQLNGNNGYGNRNVWKTYSAPEPDKGINKKGCYMSSDPTKTLSLESLELRQGLSTDSEAIQDYRTEADTKAAEQAITDDDDDAAADDDYNAGSPTPSDGHKPSPSTGSKTPSPSMTSNKPTKTSGSSSSSSNGGMSSGAIAGIAIGCVLGAAVVAGGFMAYKKKASPGKAGSMA